MLSEISTLLLKELQLEWKQKYAFNGLLLYVISMVVVIALGFTEGVRVDGEVKGLNILTLSTQTWNILFWIIMLFVAINAIAKSFVGEREGHLLYLYNVASPGAIILAKVIYNTLLLAFIGCVTLLVHALLGGADIQSPGLFGLGVLLGAFAFASTLTLVSAIASKAENKSTLLAVLSFPLIIPLLLNLIDITEKATFGFGWSDLSQTVLMTAGLSLALSLLSVILFPFVWRE